MLTPLGPDNLVHKNKSADAPINEFPDAPTIEFLEFPPHDHGSGSTSDQSPAPSQQRQILGVDDNIICINPPPSNSPIPNNITGSFGEIISGMTSLNSEITKLNIALATLRTEMTDMKNQMTNIKPDLIHSINTSVKQVMEDCLEKSFSRFAAMLDMDKRVQSAPQEGKLVEDHERVNSEQDLVNFNKMMDDKQVFEEYVSFILLHFISF